MAYLPLLQPKAQNQKQTTAVQCSIGIATVMPICTHVHVGLMMILCSTVAEVEVEFTICITHRRWGDKTSYLKNFKCSGEPKTHGCLTALTL